MSERQRQVSGLTRKLVADGIIEEASAVELHQEARSAKLPFVAYLVHEKGISAEKIAVAAADEFTTPILDLDAFDTSALPEGIVSNELIRKNHAVPLFQRGNRLFVAVSDPRIDKRSRIFSFRRVLRQKRCWFGKINSLNLFMLT